MSPVQGQRCWFLKLSMDSLLQLYQMFRPYAPASPPPSTVVTFAPDLLLKGRKEEEEEDEEGGGEEEEGKEREPLLVPPSGSPAVSASYSGTAKVTLCVQNN